MKNLLVTVSLGLCLTTLTACQKSGIDLLNLMPSSSPQTQGSLSMDCSNMSQNELDNAKLVGPLVVEKNKAATFSIVNACGDSQKVLSFSDAGTYQVNASLKASDAVKQLAIVTQVVGESLQIVGPQIGVQGLFTSFSLSNPENIPVVMVAWDFGDGVSAGTGASVTTAYDNPGDYVVSAVAQMEDGSSKRLVHPITILPLEDQFTCVRGFTVVAPATGVAGVPVDMSVFLPSCLQGQVTHVDWNFGDGSSGAGLSVVHTYPTEGSFDIIVNVFHPGTNEVWFEYPVTIVISPAPVVTTTTTTTTMPVTTTTLAPTTTTTLEPTTTTLAPTTTTLAPTTTTVIVTTTTLPPTTTTLAPTTTTLAPTTTTTLPPSCRLANGAVLPSGATQVGVINGQVQVPLRCAFGETGYFDVYNQLSDLTCQAGVLISTNVRQGEILSKGQCPVYNWMPTDKYSTCSAACGGTQTAIYECRDAAGQFASPERCGALQPASRVCDGDPESVRRVESSSRPEEANSSAVCPKNQIGVIVNQREIIDTKTYACIDHSVQLQSDVRSYSPWVEERYCRDYVAQRCSHDSLSTSQAQGRFNWMVKCAPQVPVIKDFLEEFANVQGQVKGSRTNYSLTSTNGRVLYPTFMDHGANPEKPWIAPTSTKSSCAAPGGIYVAAVCVSSCATPEEMIMAQEVASGKMGGISFIQALTQKYAYVGTLGKGSSMSSQQLQKTKVEQWVTELLDTEHQILEFRMKSGGLLKVTPNHPLISENGEMKSADEFKVGDSLVKFGGARDQILSITPSLYFGKVYNLFVKSDDLIKNVVVTNGYLNGTAFYQNEGAKNLNRNIFRQRLVRGVF